MSEQSLFAFIKSVSNDLYELAKDIESQLYDYPDNALLKIRLYCEQLIKLIFEQEDIEEIYPLNNAERIHRLYRDQAIEEDIYRKFEWIRKKGNKAAHEIKTTKLEDVIKAHRFLYDVSVWYMQVYVSYDFEPPIYDLPKRSSQKNIITTEVVDELFKPYMDQTMKKIDGIWEEINYELEKLKKERVQISSEGLNNQNKNNKKIIQKAFPLINYLENNGLTFIDNRDKNGALWVLGDWSISEKLLSLKKHKIYFRYTKKGGKATKYKPAWFLLNKNIPLQNIEVEQVANLGLKEEEHRKLIEITEIPLAYWEENGQILYPKHLLNCKLNQKGQLKGLSFLIEYMNINYFYEITDEVLRALYKHSLIDFYRVIEELYVLGFRFTGKLTLFQVESTNNQKDKIFQVYKEAEDLNEFLPQYHIQRLKKFQINRLKDLDNMLLSSVIWVLKEEYDTVIQLFENIEKKTIIESSYKIKRKTPADEIDIKNNVSEFHSPTVDSIGKQQNEITLTFKEQTLIINDEIATQPIKSLNIQGCNHLINMFEQNNIITVEDLPNQLHGIHTQFDGVGPKTIEKFWEQLCEIVGTNHLEEIDTENESESDVIRFKGKEVHIPEEIIDIELNPDDFPGSTKAIVTMKENGISTFGELAINFYKINQMKGIGAKKLESIFLRLEPVIQRLLENIKLEKLTDHERFYYELQRFEKWYKEIAESKEKQRLDKIPNRYIDLIKKRYRASLDGNHLTLEQLGQEENVTRERIRQILKKGDQRILQKWRSIVDIFTKRLESEKIIANSNLMNSSETMYLLFNALETIGIYRMKLFNTFIITSFDNNQINDYMKKIKNEMEEQFHQKVLTKDDLLKYCQERSNNDNISDEIIFTIVNDNVNWISENKGILKSMSKADVVEMVMLQYPEGVEVYKKEEELIKKANEIMPGSFNWERSFNSIVGREDLQDRFALWGRGVYIHRNFITKDEEWVHTVQGIAIKWLEDEEFIHVAKLYNEVKEEALKREVPNEYALYSLLRYYNKGMLSLPKFPDILPVGVKRIENHARIVKFIREKNRPVSIAELVEEFIENKGWKRFTLEYNLSYSKEIISYDHGYYTLLENYNFINHDQMNSIQSKIQIILKESSIVNIRKFFEDNQMYIKSIGIETAYVLYFLLKENPLDGVYFPRFPYIVTENIDGDSLAAQYLVEEFVREENRIVAREEVLNWLQEKVGAGNRVLDIALIRTTDIYYYSVGQYGEYVHRETIGLTDDMEMKIVKNMKELYDQLSYTKKRSYALLKELFQLEYLPDLPNNIPWSMKLLGDILKKSEKWFTIGSYDEILVPFDQNINNEVSFIDYILNHNFNGAVKLSKLKNFLVDIRYSSDGDLLSEVKDSLENKTAPFSIVGDELIDKKLI